ncbi:MAG: YbaN family protein [Gallionella sp.]|nr:YbaN family protein [Gallionella sp.]
MSRPKPAERRDYSHEVRKHRFLWVQVVFAALGTLFLLLGIAGMFLPILPTTPFLLLATACYARSSRRFYNWLLNHPAFGPLIVEWRTYRSIPWRVKLVAVATMILTFGSSILFFIKDGRMQLALTVFGLVMAIRLYRTPSRDRPSQQKSGNQKS